MIINLENALAVARDPGGRSRDELVVSAAYLANEVEKLQGQRDAVLAIHQREDSYVCGGSCSYCRDADEDPTKWPCPTAQALGVES